MFYLQFNDLNSKVSHTELEEKLSNLRAIHLGNEEPDNGNVLWIDDEEDDVNIQIPPGSDIYNAIQDAIRNINSKLEEVDYALSYKLDAGYIGDKFPGEEENLILKTSSENEEETPNIPKEEASGTCNTICIKRGYKRDLKNIFEGELIFCLDTDELFIGGTHGALKLLAKAGGSSGGSGGGGNISSNYVELLSNSKNAYRLTVSDDGHLQIFRNIVDTAPTPSITEPGRFKGLQIHQIFSGGNSLENKSPVSHGFIELYNSTLNSINLKGLSVQISELNGEWKALNLRGIVPPKHSFLIRCGNVSDINLPNTRLKIKDYDMNWNEYLQVRGAKVLLCIGKDPVNVINPFNIDGNGNKIDGYIDMIGVGGEDRDLPIDGYENKFFHAFNHYTSVYRRDLNDTDNTATEMDLTTSDFRTCDLSIYAPRHLGSGPWDHHYDKLKVSPNRPETLNIQFGKNGHTTRTFTWQTVRTKRGFLKYKKKGTDHWKTVKSNKSIILHGDGDNTRHSVIIKDLTPGTWVYKAGEEALWSDEYEFEVKAPTNDEKISFLQVSDQQAWNEREYKSWERAAEFIENNENFDFIINTGDISQNANRSYEWRYYFEAAPTLLSSNVHMNCCGNNDLVDKKYPTSYTYYSTNEYDEGEAQIPSVYSFNYGYIHFVCLNSNVNVAVPTGEPQPTPIADQIDWFRKDMAKPENQKRWTIVIMHNSPYQVQRTELYRPFAELFEEYNVDLVICGHHHRYTRTAPIIRWEPATKTVVVKKTESDPHGVVYVMCPATGYKTMGKAKQDTPDKNNVAEWQLVYKVIGDPGYIMWDVTYNQIKMRSYRLTGIHPLEESEGLTVNKVPIEEGHDPINGFTVCTKTK